MLAENDLEWFLDQTQLINTLRALWNSEEFRERYLVKNVFEDEELQKYDLISIPKYEVPTLCVKILLIYLKCVLLIYLNFFFNIC